jgi:hypothetical protein
MSTGTVKQPRLIFDTIFAFPPNRDTLGGTAYFILDTDEAGKPSNILVDAPAWEQGIQDFLTAHGGFAGCF